MKNCRIKKTFDVVNKHGDRHMREPFSGLYPGVIHDDEYYRKLGATYKNEELAGLQPEGFMEGTEFELEKFDFAKSAEIRETALNYFRIIDGFDMESDLVSVTELLKALHSCPESCTQGRLLTGEAVFALWMADVPFQKVTLPDGEKTVVFALDWDEISDPATYIDNDHGFENLLRPSRKWMPEVSPVVKAPKVDFINCMPLPSSCHLRRNSL